jgi:PKHD-type hydroxylase
LRPSDLPEVEAAYDRVELAGALVSRGLLRVAEDRTPAPAYQPPDGANRSAAQTTAPARDLTRSAPQTTAPARDLTLLRPAGPDSVLHLDWLRARLALTDGECDSIIKASLVFPLTDPTTVDEERYPGRRQVQARQIGLDQDTRWFLELIRDLAAEASVSHYGLTLTGISRPPQYLEYRPGQGRFECHNDYSHDQADSPRKLTVIIQLSEPADYDGGRLQIHRTETEDLPTARGSIVLFPSFLYHSVSPVTRGVRRALVCWVAGPRLR